MGQVRPRVLVSILAVVLFGTLACSRSDESTDTAQKSGSANGYSTYTIESQGLSIAVPDSWNTASSDELLDDESLEELREKSPALGEAVDQLGDPDATIKFVAFDPEVSNDFATNLNVGVIPLPDDVTERDFFSANLAEIKDAIGKSPAGEEVELPAGHALHVKWVLPGLDGAPLADQYLLFAPGRGYVLTYAALSDRVDEYAEVFQRSAETFSYD
jgi:hypothetical protein